MPGSQVDIRPVRDITPLMNTKQPFQILKMDRRRGNIVVSRRAIMEETRAEARSEIVQNLVEGQAVEGVVKNITDYGAFVDLGGVDGLLHVTDIAWRRVNHPSEVLTVGETVRVQVIKINSETQRISLGMKQLESDPWDDIETRFPLETRFTGRVTNITDYGAFVELGSGIEGLVHVSEMSWVKKNVHPGKIVSTSQEVEVMVLEVDSEKRRISLGLKQCMANPWEDFASRYPVGTKVSGEIKNITEFGLFVGLEDEIDGMVHMSDLDWNLSGDDALAGFSKGQTVEAVVLEVDMDKERVSLGVKQLDGDPFESLGDLRRGSTVTCEVTAVTDGGLEVGVGDADVSAFIRRSDLSRDREDQRPERFNVGDKLDAMVTNIDQRARRIGLSIKALEIAEEKEAVEQYGSSDSGASLGDILGAALNRDDDVKSDDGGRGLTGSFSAIVQINGATWSRRFFVFLRLDAMQAVWQRSVSRGKAIMIKSELVARISEQYPHLYQRDVEAIINRILNEIGDAMGRGDRIELRGFGAFSVKQRAARIGRNPRTGDSVAVAKKVAPFFKTGKELRDRLNNKIS